MRDFVNGSVGLVCVVALLLPQAAMAERVSVALRDVTALDNYRGQSNIALKHEALTLPANVLIGSAVLTFSKATRTKEPLEVIVHLITTAWDPASVDWSTGWTRPGGDVDDRGTRGQIRFDGSGTATLDVTALVKQTVEEGVFGDGFLITVPSFAGEGIPTAVLGDLNVGSGQLTLTYRVIGAPGSRRSAGHGKRY